MTSIVEPAFGADVTGVCSAGNVDLVRSIGAGRVIDYAREDFAQGAQRYDVSLDCIGAIPCPHAGVSCIPRGNPSPWEGRAAGG